MNYNGASIAFYPAQGIFGMNGNKTFVVSYSSATQEILYNYPKGSTNKAGHKPEDVHPKNLSTKIFKGNLLKLLVQVYY